MFYLSTKSDILLRHLNKWLCLNFIRRDSSLAPIVLGRPETLGGMTYLSDHKREITECCLNSTSFISHY